MSSESDAAAEAGSDLRDVEHRLMRGLCGRDDLTNRTHRDGFRETADLETHRRKRKTVVREHHVVADLDRPEAAELRADGVRTRLQRGKCKEAHLVGDRAPHFLRLLVRDDDVGARNNLILRIDDCS